MTCHPGACANVTSLETLCHGSPHLLKPPGMRTTIGALNFPAVRQRIEPQSSNCSVAGSAYLRNWISGTGRKPVTSSLQAAEAVARYLRSHRREAAERGVPPSCYRPPTLAQVARHLAEDAGLRPQGGGAWAPSSVQALVRRAASR